MLRIPALLAVAAFGVATATAQLRITEFVADNDGSHLDEDGAASDWVEIHNAGVAAASLSGHFLTDDPDDLTKWAFPDVSVPAGGYLVIFASTKDRAVAGSELHTNFSLSSGGEYLGLIGTGGAIAVSEFSPEYPNQFFGVSFGTGVSGGVIETSTPIPWPAPATWFVPTADIGTSWRDTDFDDAAWNAAQTGLGFGYTFPDFIGAGGDTRSAMFGIVPGCYIRIPFQVDEPAGVVSMLLEIFHEDAFIAYLNGEEVARDNIDDPVSFNSTANSSREIRTTSVMQEFPLDFAGKLVAGENILAFHMMNNASASSDVLLIPTLTAETRDVSLESIAGYLESPTPGTPNSTIEFSDFVRDTNFDIDRGFFDAPFDVTITTPTPGATIVYTTDGSTPTLENGTQVPAPDTGTPPAAVVNIVTSTPLRAAAFRSGYRPSNVDTQTYLFLEDVLDQPAQPPGYPLPWRSRNGNSIPGDFEMDPDVVGPIYSREELKTALRDLPTISIVTDIDNLFDQQTGIQVNPQDSGPSSERRVSVEMMDFEDGTPIQLDAGMLMNGNASRSTNRGKHNFRLAFRNRYGAGKLNFPLFGAQAPTETFNQIILRGGNGNSWVHPSASVRQYAMYIRDQWFRDAHTAMGYPEALQREVHVYFNGLYFGLHHLFERIEEEWTAERFGGEDEDWEGFRIVGGNNIEVISGTPAEVSARMLDSWRAVLDAAEVGDLAGVEQYLDLDSYIDYLLLNFHAGNNDWDQNNVRGMRRRNPDGKYMFFCHDAERAGFNALNTANININVTTKNTARGPTQINTDLRTHPNSRVEYGLRFADRAYKHLFNDGALTPENGAAQWAARAANIREAMKCESARWGDHAENNPRTLTDFDNGLNREYNQWFPFRTPVTISQLRGTDLYPAIDPPTFNQHGGMVATGFPLLISNTEGDIYFTTDGSDPRLAGGGINPDATQLDGSLVEAELVLSGSDWSYLDDGTDQGTAWREPGFDDAAWPVAPAPLGFGGISNIPPLGSGPGTGTLINPDRHLTNYFRKTVTVTGAALLTEASVSVMADGGAVVYINGTEVTRDNMPAGTITFATGSDGDGGPEGQFNTYTVDPSTFDPFLFVEGDNVIAVESHNVSTVSSDMVMDIRINTVGLNPDGGAMPIDQTTTVRARSLDGNDWSALAEATFIIGQLASSENLVISELHYNPAGPDESGEFIELMNISDEPVSLAGVAFTSGVGLAFGDADAIAPGGRLVVTPADYEGQLDNGGESLTLSAGETVIQSFRYDDRAPWPVPPDGSGHSLTLIAPESAPDHGDPANWRSSVATGGSPGTSDAVAFTGATDAELIAYATGNPYGGSSVEVRTIEVDGSLDDYLVITVPRDLAADDAIVSVEFSSDLETWETGSEFLGTSSEAGPTTTAAWRSALPLNAPGSPSYSRVLVELRQ